MPEPIVVTATGTLGDTQPFVVTPDKNGPRSHSTDLYLNLMKRVLTNVIYQDPPRNVPLRVGLSGGVLRKPKIGKGYDGKRRAAGRDWPSVAHTMVGLERLNNVQMCVERVIADDVAGDLIETGVWRGGVCIFMCALLEAHGVTDRTVWVADSFQGMPRRSAKMPLRDRIMGLDRCNNVLAISLDEVKENFRRYNLLDDQVKFLPGWFADTLPTVPLDKLAVLRLDGDLYGSTMDALVNLYPKLSVGGYLIVDDYMIPACRKAVHDYRARAGINEEIVKIDDDGVYWRRTT